MLKWIARFSLLLSAAGLCGCQSLLPHRPALLFGRNEKKEQERLTEYKQIQNEVMRFADVYSAMTAQGFDELAAKSDTSKARASVIDRKASQSEAAISVATGTSPIVNLMDMVVLVTLTRMSQEDYWVPKVYGDKGLPLLALLKSREDEIWKVAARYLTPEQLQELRVLIHDWRKKYPEQHYTAFLRFAEFATMLGANVEEQGKKRGSIFSLLDVDPLANLKPAVRQLEQTRYLAERAMFYFHRLPIILQWRAQVVLLDAAGMREVQQTLAMSERWTKVVEQLPSLIPSEREAAINQFFAGVANERTNLIHNLTTQEPRVSDLLTNLQSTLVAGRETAQAATELVKSSDELYQRFQKSQESPGATNKRPFDVRDYTELMSETANTATQLNAMVVSGGQNLPKVQQAGKELADHIFRLALLFLVAITIVALVYRWLVWALFKAGPRS